MEVHAKHFRKRDAILNCLRATTAHPGAEEIFEAVRKEIPNISLATVYRNLSLFKEQGLIASLGTVKGVERFDGNTAPHVHFICTGCDRVLDLSVMEVPASLSSTAAECSGGTVNSCQLTFHGRCAACQNLK